MIRAAVIGSTGQLGSDVVRVLESKGNYEVFPLSHSDIECTELSSVKDALTVLSPDVVVNCAGFVRVDECEDNPELAFSINSVGAFYVAKVSADLDALSVYVSTDYVFDGKKGEPYTEDDVPNPINVYGTSKLSGEYLVSQTCPRWLVVRTASLFGGVGALGKGGNFVETILEKARSGQSLRVVDDVRMSPTYTLDAASSLEELISREATGVCHATNAGSCSWYEFAEETLRLAGIESGLQPVASSEYSTKASRPHNSSLISARLTEYDIRPWEKALEAYLIEKEHVNSKS